MPRSPRRWRIVLLALALVACAAALALYLARDAPRRAVESALSERTGAPVALGELGIESTSRIVLRDLVIGTMPALPIVHEVRIETLVATGDPRAMNEGVFETLELDGVDVVLGAPREPAVVGEDAASPSAGSLVVRGLRVHIGSLDRERALLTGTASLQDAGKPAMRGSAALSATELDLRAWLGLAPELAAQVPAELEASLREVRVDVSLDGSGATTVAVRAAGGEAASVEGRLALPELALDASVRDMENAALSVTWSRGTPLGEGSFEAALVVDPPALASAAGRIDALDVGPLVALWPGARAYGLRMDGRANATLGTTGESRARITIDSDALDAHAVLDGGAARDADAASPSDTLAARVKGVSLEADIPLTDLDAPMTATLRATLTALNGLASVPASVMPVQMRAQAGLAHGLDGDADLALALDARDVGTLSVVGTLANPFADDATWNAAWRWNGPALGEAWGIAARAGFALPELVLDGPPLVFAGRISGPLSAPSLTLAGELAGLGIAPAAPNGAWAVRDATATIAARAEVLERGVALPSWSIALAGSAEAQHTLRAPFVVSLAGTLAEGGRLDASAEIDLAEGAVRARAPRVRFDAGAIDAEVAFEIADLERVRQLARPLTGDFLPGFVAKGSLSGTFDVGRGSDGIAEATGALAVVSLGLASNDGARVAEGFAGTWQVEASHSPAGAIAADARARLGGALVLWDAFFADLSALESDARLTIRAPASASEPWTAAASLALEPGVALSLSLAPTSAGSEALGASLDASVRDLGRLVDERLREPLQDALPMLRTARLGGGVRAALHGTTEGERIEIAGDIALDGLALALDDAGVACSGFDLALPIGLRLEGGDPAGEQPAARAGSMRLAHARAMGIEIGPIASALVSRGDGVALAETLTIPVLGGVASFSDLSLADLLSPERGLEAALEIDGVSLAALSETLEIFPLEGVMQASFPRVKLGPGRFEAQGGGVVTAFGGSVTIGDIVGEDVLSRYPRFDLSATLRGIDLAGVTRTLGFGEMTGFVDGEIDDLLMVGGVPVRFEATLRSVDERRESRTVNVKAVNNLTVLGTGSPGVLDRGITRFFDRFTYDRLGIRMSLADDRFTLRGLEKRGERELFLKGRLPAPIDIVNGDPGRAVSFKAMLRRFQELDLSKVRME